MKEIYTKPMAEVEEFAAVEILTASAATVDPANPDQSEFIDGGWD